MLLAFLMAVAEVAGAVVYRNYRLLTYFSLGFAASMAVFDMLPDAGLGYLAYTLFLLGVLLTVAFQRNGRKMALAGMGFHDFFEGLLASFTLTPLTALALVLHKLPEGMAVLSLFDRDIRPLEAVKLVLPFAMLIPAGAIAGQAFTGFSVVIAFCAGVVFGTTTRLIAEDVSTVSISSAAVGAVIAILTSLVV